MQTQSKSLCYIIAIPKGMAIILESEVISMKNRKLLVAGLCGALCLSLAGFTHASAQATDAPKTSAEETAQMSSTDILFNDADGISTDGENWVEEADYEKNNPAPDIEWWTAEEYEKWIATQKEELEALIGTGDGWYDGQGVFHEWTQESVDATIAEYQETLESIKNGTLYSKDNGEGDTYSMIPPTEDVVSEYGVNVTKENGESVHIGNYASNEELDKALNDAVDNGQLTQAEADAANQQ